jgi:uncharacterized protein YcbK (DUF882 family)
MSYFQKSEFDSPDAPGSGSRMDPHFLEVLESVRGEAGIPMKVNSGYRTIAHNLSVGGGPNSAHLRGMAADINANTGRQKYLILRAAMLNGIKRIGIGKTFLHLDIDSTLPNLTIWLY